MAYRVPRDVLERALDHLVIQGDTDILPPAFEVNALRSQRDDIVGWLASCDVCSWETRPLRRCLSPKRRLGLRVATQLDPIDALLITALVLLAGEAIERSRIPASDLVVHSHRFQRDLSFGRLYAPEYTYRSFRVHSIELAEHTPGYVVLADIADFYQRIYTHRLESALGTALARETGLTEAITGLLKKWNHRVSYGVPIGPAPVRLLAEATIDDVDRLLQASGYTFCRYSDDFRIFVPTRRKAHEALAELANALFTNHGLSLQEAKTEILPTEEFISRFSREEADEAADELQNRFDGLLSEVGIDSYGLIGLDEISPEVLDQVEKANLWQVLRHEISAEQPNVQMIRFALRQIANAGLPDRDGTILKSLDKLIGVFPDAVRAATASPAMTAAQMKDAAGNLLSLVENGDFGHLDYFRAWVLYVFRDSSDWNHVERLVKLHRDHTDSFTRSAATYALGVSGAHFWFRNKKDQIWLMDPWERRAFLAGSACLNDDERRHWRRAIARRLDELDRAVLEWGANSELATRVAAPATVGDVSAGAEESPWSTDWSHPSRDDDVPF